MESIKEVVDSLCISQRSKDGSEERVILFLKMAPETPLTQELVKQVRTSIRLNLSARHVPAIIMETQDIPVSTGNPWEWRLTNTSQRVEIRTGDSKTACVDVYRECYSRFNVNFSTKSWSRSMKMNHCLGKDTVDKNTLWWAWNFVDSTRSAGRRWRWPSRRSCLDRKWRTEVRTQTQTRWISTETFHSSRATSSPASLPGVHVYIQVCRAYSHWASGTYLPTAYVVGQEGYVLTRVCPSVCPHRVEGVP